MEMEKDESEIDEPSRLTVKQQDSRSLKKYITCQLCSKELDRPITLPCLHSFCLECLQVQQQEQRQREEDRRARMHSEEVAKQFGQPLEPSANDDITSTEIHDFSIRGLEVPYYSIPCKLNETDFETQNRDPFFMCCPLQNCDGVTNIPLGNVTRLKEVKPNYALLNIEHTLSVKRDLPYGRTPCGTCGKPAIGVCYNKDCNNQPYCANCLEFHLRDNKRHAIAYPHSHHQNENEDSELETSSEDDTKQFSTSRGLAGEMDLSWGDLKQCDVLCDYENHERFFRNLYCQEHDEVICLACTGTGGLHRRCAEQVANTGELYGGCVGVTERKLNNLKKLNDYFQASMRTTEEVRRALEVKVETMQETIKTRHAQLEEELREHCNSLLKKCDTIVSNKQEELDQHLDLLRSVHEQIEYCISFVEDFKATAIPSEFMMMKMQMDARVDQLFQKYSNYRCETNQDDCIFLEENKTFDVSNAIGKVFSTPSVKNFTISAATKVPMACQVFYLVATINDVVGNELLCHTTMPNLHATIRHVDESEIIEGTVERDKGKYYIILYPSRSGEHEICIYQPLDPPYDRLYAGGKKYIVNVNV